VVRPVRAPCGERAALSWDCDALRGRPRPCCHAYRLRGSRTAFLRPPGTAWVESTSGLLRAPPSVRLSLPFRGPSHHPRTVPGARRLRSSDDASFPGLSCPSTHAGAADPSSAGHPALRRATSEVLGLHRGVHHRPSESLAAPERPRAFLFEAFSSHRSDSLSEAPALLPLRASDRLAPIGACGRDRLQGLDPDGSSCWPSRLAARRVDASLGLFPPERSPPPSLRALRGFAPAPSTRVGRD
jgi:hypothetical protein